MISLPPFCGILQATTNDPYRLECSHVFDRIALYRWLAQIPSCPNCRIPIDENLRFKAKVITFLHSDLTQGVIPATLLIGGVAALSYQRDFYHTAALIMLLSKNFLGVYASITARLALDQASILDYGHLALSTGLATMLLGAAFQSNSIIYAAINLSDLGTGMLVIRLFIEYAELNILSAIYGFYLAACLSPLYFFGRYI